NARGVLVDLLLDHDSASVVYEVFCFKRESFRYSHSGGCEQNVKCLFLAAAPSNEFRNRVCLKRWTLLLRMLHNGKVYRFGIPDSLVNRLAVDALQRRQGLLDELNIFADGSSRQTCCCHPAINVLGGTVVPAYAMAFSDILVTSLLA